jgi:nucleotide-binding universal stress UspA family protein
MFQHLLVATDGSQDGEEALCEGLGLAKALSAR